MIIRMTIQNCLQKMMNYLSFLAISVCILFSLATQAQYERQWLASNSNNSSSYNNINISNHSNTNNTYFRFEQRLVLAYLLESVGLSESKKVSLALRMEKMLKEISKRGFEWVEVSSVDDYIKEQKGEWPNTHRLSLDLRALEKRFDENSQLKAKMYYSQDPAVQNQILNYHVTATHHFVQMIQSYKIPLLKALADFSLKSIKAWTENFREIPQSINKAFQQAMDLYQTVSREGLNLERLHQSREALSSTVTQHLLLQSFSAAESILQSMMGEIEPIISEILKELQGVGLNPGEMRALEILFKGYFHELSLESKKLMLNALLELPTNATVFEKFQLMVQLADPVFQKCMQLFARTDNMSPKMEKIFQSLESSGREVPWFIAESIMEPELKKYDLIDISKESLGVGTQRVYYVGKLRLPNGELETVVIGILKPDIPRRVDEGERIMKTLAVIVDADPLVQKSGFPKLASFIHDALRFIRRETNTDETRKWQARFIEAYKKQDTETLKKYGITLEFLAPEVFEPRGGSSSLLVQKFVRGEKLDEAFTKSVISIPELKRIVVEQLANLWMGELLFGSGLYHGDLHHGNFKVLMNYYKIFFSIIDYGMSGQLSVKGRSQFMKLGASIELLDAPLMTDIFLTVSDKNFTHIKREELLQKIQEKIQIEGMNVSREADEWIKYVTRFDFKLRPEFMDMMRGYLTIKQLLKEVKSKMNLTEEAKKMAMRHPVKGSFVMLLGSVGTPRPSFWKMTSLILEAQLNQQNNNTILSKVTNKIPQINKDKVASAIQNKSSLIGQCRGLFLKH